MTQVSITAVGGNLPVQLIVKVRKEVTSLTSVSVLNGLEICNQPRPAKLGSVWRSDAVCVQ